MHQHIKKSEMEAHQRQIRKLTRFHALSDLVYVLIFIVGQRYRELVVLLLLQIPVNLLLLRLVHNLNSRLKALMILLQNTTLFIFANILGEAAMVQVLFLCAFLSQITHLRPQRGIEWAAVLAGPVLWNILEWHNYNVFHLTRSQPEWMVPLMRLVIINSSFIFLFLVFDFLRLRFMEIQNEMVAVGTHLQQAKSTIERQQSALVQNSRMQALGEMAGGIAHEINNPLSIIEAQVYALRAKLQKGALTTADMVDSIQNLEKTSTRISHIIQSLLQISGDGKRDAFQNVSVVSILAHVEDLCRQKFQHHGVDLMIDKDVPESLLIPCHQSQIAQVLLSLLSNAFDAVLGASERWVRVWTVHDTERVVFIVSDSGPGLAPQQKSRLFQPFSSSKPIGKGIGLGLSIAKGMVEQHQGLLWLDTSARFTTFKVELPLANPSEIPGQT
ncbi:MAG TPA: ATP-binding protein [Oligoflexus sp.]|uniref:sensor histidine kinase n=1 Tax=Oligoflexus sp. TaxID=1971216 RepID=UPI002D5A673C|nr:ATP-binding protein [Oligoflexus sp.]HYX37302.1 ATP-binding protein [Oligoflexus sp.]